MCVCVFSSHSFWTSSSLDVSAGVTQEEGHTGFLIHLLPVIEVTSLISTGLQTCYSVQYIVYQVPGTGEQIGHQAVWLSTLLVVSSTEKTFFSPVPDRA